MKLKLIFQDISLPLFWLLLALTLNCGSNTTLWAQANVQPEQSGPPTTIEPTPTKSVESPSWPTFEKAFEAGVSNYQSKKYDEARLAFSQALDKNPESIQALTNLAFAQFQLGQKGFAVALLRKAHSLDPQFSTPKAALDFILPQMPVREIPHEIQLWESVRSSLVEPFSMSSFLFLSVLSFFSSGWLFLQFLGRRRRALREEKPLPSFPTIPVIITLVFLASTLLVGLKIWDHQVPRATIVSEKTTVYSAPSEQSAALFDLYAGLEVILNSSNQDWVQVTYPGALTGWVPKASLFQTSGRNLW